MISTLEQAEKTLLKYVPNVRKYAKDGLSLDRMWPILEVLGNPQDKLKVVHVAGTSGKTSTAYYLSALLQKRYAKVGLTVSPHVDMISERVQINGEPLDEKQFCNYLQQFIDILDSNNFTPSYFELLIMFALWVFYKEKVDYVVVETGMGGLLDGSNVVTNSSKICALTDIGFDHQNILGNTLPEISLQKAGIMHAGNVAFCYEQSTEITAVFSEYASKVGATLNVFAQDELSKNSIVDVSQMPEFQQRNWLLASVVSRYVFGRDSLTQLSTPELASTTTQIVPARMQEIVIDDGKKIIMDGAHNQQKMRAFVSSLRAKYGDRSFPILLALKEGKDYHEVIDELLPISSQIIFSTFDTSQDLPAVSMEPTLLAEYCEAQNFQNYRIITNHNEAYKELLNDVLDIGIATGSFYLLSQIRHDQ